VWLVLAALSFAAIMEHAGFLERILRPVVERAPTRGRLIASVNASGIGLNVIAGDQYVADVLPARMFSGEFERRGLAPEVLSRAVEDSGTVTSVGFKVPNAGEEERAPAPAGAAQAESA